MENGRTPINLLDFSDYVLLEVLKHLNSTDLWQLYRTCERFRYLVPTKKLWRRIDLRDPPIVRDKVAFAMQNANELTGDVRMCSERRHQRIIPDDFLQCLSHTNLTVLALENQSICGNSLSLKDFPESLTELSLRKTYVTDGRAFLYQSNERMKNLKVLILDQCFWLEANMLVQLSKYRLLEVLSLYNCRRISDRDIAYISLAGRYGFKSLRLLDCRFAGLGDQMLRALYDKRTLREIYFQSYPTTYFLEKGNRQLEIHRGSPVGNHSYTTELDDIPMFDKKTIEFYFGETDFQKMPNLNAVSDEGTVVYRFTESLKETDSFAEFKSVLYERPYSECNCSRNGTHPNHFSRHKGPSHKMKSLKRRNVAKTEELIANELQYATGRSRTRNLHLLVPVLKDRPDFDLNLEATMDNRYADWIRRRSPRNDYEMAMLEHSDLNGFMVECNVTLLVLDNSAPSQLLAPHRFARSPSLPDLGAEGTSAAADGRPNRASGKRKRNEDGVRTCRLVRRAAAVVANDDNPRAYGRYALIEDNEPAKYKVALAGVSLRGFRRVTDRTLECLSHLNLKLLDVTYTDVTDRGVKEFATLNPDCRVVHESLCRCGPRMHF